MKILDKVQSVFSKKFFTTGIQAVFQDSSSMPQAKDYLDSFESSHLVHACVTVIGNSVAKTELQLFKVAGSSGKEVINEETDHDLLDLLARPNQYQTGFELFREISISLDLQGNAYIFKNRTEQGEVVELWLLRPDWVKVLPGEEKLISGYEFHPQGGGVQTFKPEDIIHIKEPNPKSFFYGMPTIKPALEVVRNMVFAIRWNQNFFYNNARPDFLIKTKTRMQDKDRKAFKDAWDRQFRGLERSNRFGFLYGEDTEIEILTKTLREMEFSKLIDVSATEILAAFRVPQVLLGRKGVNRAETESQIFVFLSETVEPRVKLIMDKLNEFLVVDFGAELFLDFVDITPEDREGVTDGYERGLKNNWLVINEVRDMEGLPPVDGGWDIYLPISMVSVGGVPEGDRTKGYVRLKGKGAKDYYENKEVRKQAELKKRVLTGKKRFKKTQVLKESIKEAYAGYLTRVNALKFTDEKKKELWESFEKQLQENERLFKSVVVGLFNSQEKRISDNVGEFKKSINDIVNWENEKHVFFRVSLPFITNIVKESGEAEAALIGETFNVNSNVQEFMNNKTLKFAEEVNDTTKKALQKTLSEGISQGEGIQPLKKRVHALFADRKDWEAERIARTEVVGASNGGAWQANLQSEVVEKNEWLATMDDRVRDSHASLNGQIVEKSGRFSNGLRFPGDSEGSASETVNCRCSLLPVVE